MIELSFKQTGAERIVRAAATLLFKALERSGAPVQKVSCLAERPQYGFTASAVVEPVGPRFVRITDLQDGKINWDTVPFCECPEPEKYTLKENDILFARTGATTGKTHLVISPPASVFASYLIRLRPKHGVDSGFLHAFFQSDTYWLQIADEKEGSAQPNVNGEKLSELRIPFAPIEIQRRIKEFLRTVRLRQDGEKVELAELPPPLSEQLRIVARIEELAAQIAEARKLRSSSTEGCDLLCRSILAASKSEATPLRNIVKLRNPDVVVQPEESYQFAGVYCFGRGVFKGNRKSGTEFKYSRLTRVRTGNFVYPKLMAWEGAFGIVPEECEGCVVSPEFPVFEAIEERIMPEVLDTFFRSPSVWQEISGASTGTNVRRRRLNPKDFLDFHFPVPPLEVQRQLRVVYQNLRASKVLQTETSAELDALLPSILDKAFKGEL